MTSICHYLEVAPSGWFSVTDPTRTWAQSSPDNYQSTNISDIGDWTQGVGFGAYMTNLILEQGNTNPATSAAALAAAHSNTFNSVNFTDWYLPSSGELRELCLNYKSLGSTFTPNTYYWSSTTVVSENARYLHSPHGWPTCETSSGFTKAQAFAVRPIRAF